MSNASGYPYTPRIARRVALANQQQIVHALLTTISPFPARPGMRLNILQPGQTRCQGFTLGQTKTRDGRTALVNSRFNARFPELLLACERLINLVDPDFRFDCIQVNKDQQTAQHVDAYNEGPSYIVALGDFTDGELVLHYTDGNVDYKIKNNPLQFDGHIPHSTRPFSGSRFSLVFFRVSHTRAKPRSMPMPGNNVRRAT
jgi:hypothetical protein